MNIEYFAFWGRTTSDSEWLTKLVIVGLLLLVGGVLSYCLIGLPLVFAGVGFVGWSARRAYRGDPALPTIMDGNSFVEAMKLGAIMMVVYFVWMLPLVLLRLLFQFGEVGAVGAGQLGDGGMGLSLALAGVSFILALFQLVYGILWVAPATMIVALSGQAADGFSPSKIMSVFKAGFLDLLILALVTGIMYFVLVLGGLLLLCVGLIPAVALAGVMYGDVFGQFLRGVKLRGVDLTCSTDDSPGSDDFLGDGDDVESVFL